MANKQCPTCGLEYDTKIFTHDNNGNRHYFTCPKGHRHEWEKIGEHDWQYRHSYPFTQTKK